MSQELELIRNFIAQIPQKITSVLEQTDFLENIEKLNALDAFQKKASMRMLYSEASSLAYKHSEEVASSIGVSLKNEKEVQILQTQLKNVGLTGSSLAIKGSVFTLLWDKLDQLMSKGVKSIQDLTKELMNALNFLSDFLGSLKIVFPQLESLKELAELIIGLLNVLNYQSA
jgi:hypothetical protein